jgi:transposase-like protein
LIAQAVNLYINLGLSLRQAAFAIKQFWQVRVSYETIQSWVVSLAAYLAPLVKLFALPLSGIVVNFPRFVGQ